MGVRSTPKFYSSAPAAAQTFEGIAEFESEPTLGTSRIPFRVAIDRATPFEEARALVELYGSLRKRREVIVEEMSPFDVELELSAAGHRAGLFEKLFGREVEFRQGLEKKRRRR